MANANPSREGYFYNNESTKPMDNISLYCGLCRVTYIANDGHICKERLLDRIFRLLGIE